MMEWLDIYLSEMDSSDQMVNLIYNFFEKIKQSEHYLRGPVNDILLETLVRGISFRLIGLPKDTIQKKIDRQFLSEVKTHLLNIVMDELYKGEPIPPPKPKALPTKGIGPGAQKGMVFIDEAPKDEAPKEVSIVVKSNKRKKTMSKKEKS